MELKAMAHSESILGNSSVHLARSESDQNIYDMITNSVNTQQGNSFMSVFVIPEFQHLLQSAALFQIAVYVIYFLYLDDPPNHPVSTTTLTPQQYFFYGSAGAFLTTGIFSDLILQGKASFFLMAVFIGLEVVNAGLLFFPLE